MKNFKLFKILIVVVIIFNILGYYFLANKIRIQRVEFEDLLEKSEFLQIQINSTRMEISDQQSRIDDLENNLGSLID